MTGICAAIVSVFCLLAFVAGPAAASGVTATTDPATAVTSQSGDLLGTFSNPAGATGYSYYFEYGTTSAYGQQTVSNSLPSNMTQCCQVQVSNLTSGTTYHFQLVLLAPDSTQTLGGDQSFTTGSNPTGLIDGSVISAATTNPCTDAQTPSAPLPGVTVTAYSAGSNTPAGLATSASNGSFEITGLPYGSYVLEFTDSGYSTQWFNDQPSASTATSISVPFATQASAVMQPLPLSSSCPPSTAYLTGSPISGSPSTATFTAVVIGGDTAKVAYGPASSTWCTSGGDAGAPASTTAPPTTIPIDWNGSLTVTGLASDATYCAQLTATNAGGTLASKFVDWQQIAPPSVTVDKIVSTLGTSATIDASLVPKPAATYQVQYGPASSGWCLGTENARPQNTTSSQTAPVGSPAWNAAVTVSVKLSGLRQGTVYCAQLEAFDTPSGTFQGVGSVTPPIYFTAGGGTVDVSACVKGGACFGAAQSLLIQALKQGGAARIATFLARGAYATRFTAAYGGTLQIVWRAGRAVLASGEALVNTGQTTVQIKLTGKGRARLSHADTLKVTATGTYTYQLLGKRQRVVSHLSFTLRR